MNSSRNSGKSLSSRAVNPASTIPGAIAFTVIPCGASSKAAQRASIHTPALETQYGAISL